MYFQLYSSENQPKSKKKKRDKMIIAELQTIARVTAVAAAIPVFVSVCLN